MLHKAFIKALSAIGVVGLVFLLVGYVHHKNDPFSAYKDFIKKPISIQEKKLKYYQNEERFIREKLKLNLSEKERVILAGIHFLITFVDNDDNFDFLFSDFMLLMRTLSLSGDRTFQREVAESVVKTSFKRAEHKLDSIFQGDEDDMRWEFIRLLSYLTLYPELQKSYYKFYEKQFEPKADTGYQADGTKFATAIRVGDYRALFGYLVQTSFLHYFLDLVPNPPVKLPLNKFPEHLKEFESFRYSLNHPIENPLFRGQGYLVTHVPLVLTNYGEFPIKDGENKRKAQDYIEASFDKTYDLGDFDLYAEYIMCLKIFNPGRDPRIKDLEAFLYSLQRPDGSWGTAHDFETSPYTVIHPTGAALMALNQADDLIESR